MEEQFYIDIKTMTVSQQVQYVRMQLGLSQEALADKLGVGYSTVSRLERKHGKPQLVTLGKFYSFCKRNNVEIRGGF